MLKAQHITFCPAGVKPILSGLSFALQAGQMKAIVGPNGAGKSSLLKILSGEVPPCSGSVTINGHSLSDLSAQQLSHHRAVLSQSVSITLPFRVTDIVMMGRLPFKTRLVYNQRVVQGAMEEANVGHLQDRLYTTLSGGEQQRVQLARVLAQVWDEADHPRFVLLDEPTASLDIAQQHLILAAAKALTQKNIGVMAVIHDLNLAAQYADELYLLKNGCRVACGCVFEVLKKELIETTFSHPVHLIENGKTGIPLVVPEAIFQPKHRTTYSFPS
jgi:iron complex transport system ATP-binding protein